MAILEADGVGKVYETRGVETAALDNIDLAIEEGDFAALAGPSGSGKTTLLNLLGALDEPSWGEVRIDGQALAALGPAQLSELRLRKLGFVFQAYNLIPVFSAAENIEFVMELQGVPAGERRKRALELLAQVELEGLGDKRPLEMSGGQQQRVAVARALASQPRVILADEPTANLDSKTAIRLLDLMVDLNRNQGTTFLFSSHDPLVLERAKRRVWLRDGVIDRIEEGSTA
jgi:putative ABC transport system ATP-binding protein